MAVHHSTSLISVIGAEELPAVGSGAHQRLPTRLSPRGHQQRQHNRQQSVDGGQEQEAEQLQEQSSSRGVVVSNHNVGDTVSLLAPVQSVVQSALREDGQQQQEQREVVVEQPAPGQTLEPEQQAQQAQQDPNVLPPVPPANRHHANVHGVHHYPTAAAACYSRGSTPAVAYAKNSKEFPSVQGDDSDSTSGSVDQVACHNTPRKRAQAQHSMSKRRKVSTRRHSQRLSEPGADITQVAGVPGASDTDEAAVEAGPEAGTHNAGHAGDQQEGTGAHERLVSRSGSLSLRHADSTQGLAQVPAGAAVNAGVEEEGFGTAEGVGERVASCVAGFRHGQVVALWEASGSVHLEMPAGGATPCTTQCNSQGAVVSS